MRRVALCCGIAVLVACAKKEEPAPAESAAAPSAPIQLADVAGAWTVKTMNEAKDTTLVTYEITATADPAGWTLTFPNRPALPMRVSTGGDSIITEVGPYESVLRRGVQVWTHSVLRLADNKLVGSAVAHYTATGPDSVRRLVMEGTRK